MIKRKRLIVKDIRIKGTLTWVTGLIAGILVMFSPYVSLADVTYTYTGNAYDSFMVDSVGNLPYQYDDTNMITASFTIDQLLTASYSGDVTPSSFVISDGIYTITQDDAPQAVFQITTDSDGNISEWEIAAQTVLSQFGLTHGVMINSTCKLAAQTRDMSLDNVCGGSSDYEQIQMCVESSTPVPPGYSQMAHVLDTRGTWTVSQVPEPAPDDNSEGSDETDTDGDSGGGGGDACFIDTLEY